MLASGTVPSIISHSKKKGPTPLTQQEPPPAPTPLVCFAKTENTGKKKSSSIIHVRFIIKQYHFFLFVVLAHGKLMSIKTGSSTGGHMVTVSESMCVCGHDRHGSALVFSRILRWYVYDAKAVSRRLR